MGKALSYYVSSITSVDDAMAKLDAALTILIQATNRVSDVGFIAGEAGVTDALNNRILGVASYVQDLQGRLVTQGVMSDQSKLQVSGALVQAENVLTSVDDAVND